MRTQVTGMRRDKWTLVNGKVFCRGKEVNEILILNDGSRRPAIPHPKKEGYYPNCWPTIASIKHSVDAIKIFEKVCNMNQRFVDC